MSHFEGKSVVEHLKEARSRGAAASSETHGTEMPGQLAALADALKETSIVLLLLITLFYQTSFNLFALLFFSLSWIIWKTGRSALLGWARLERLHRLIEQERWEIEHHRDEEREELTEMYQAKGLSGKLLTDVIDVLMADDNRLLRVMLEEELGLSLEQYDHPLKQAFGALIGALIPPLLILPLAYFFSPIAAICLAFVLIGLATAFAAHIEQNRRLQPVIWTLSLSLLAFATTYFLLELFPF